MTSRVPKSLAALCTAAALALAASGCTNASSTNGAAPSATGSQTATTYQGTDFTKNEPVNAPGVTSTEIHVGSITSKTNPIGGDNFLLNDGIKAYFDVVNGQGGVWGRKLKLTSERDDQTASNLNQTQAMLAQDNVFAVFEAVELFTGAKLLARPASRRSDGTSTRSGPARRTSSQTSRRSASARPAARSAKPCPGSCRRKAGTRSRSSATPSHSRPTP